jgi:polygalacturonase
MRCALLLALLPLALGCDNPANDACAAAYTASRSAADAFCATFTTSTVTATTGLPAFASACNYNTKHLSSACSCIDTAWATAAAVVSSQSIATSDAITTSDNVATTAPAVVTTTPTTLVTATRAASSSSSSTLAQASVTTAPTVADSVTEAAGTGSTCVVTAYASISSAVKSCTNIVLSNISAPPSSTIDLQSLQTGATVTFAGTTVRYNGCFSRLTY